MYVILFILASVGLTNILVDPAKIAEPLRKFTKEKFPKVEEMLSCYQCCGFWVGVLLSCLLWQDNPLLGTASAIASIMGFSLFYYLFYAICGSVALILTAIFAGFASSFSATFFGYVMNYLLAQSTINSDE